MRKRSYKETKCFVFIGLHKQQVSGPEWLPIPILFYSMLTPYSRRVDVLIPSYDKLPLHSKTYLFLPLVPSCSQTASPGFKKEKRFEAVISCLQVSISTKSPTHSSHKPPQHNSTPILTQMIPPKVTNDTLATESEDPFQPSSVIKSQEQIIPSLFSLHKRLSYPRTSWFSPSSILISTSQFPYGLTLLTTAFNSWELQSFMSSLCTLPIRYLIYYSTILRV